ncbi:transcriptional protein SWT1 [Aplochiton taeniatus]
MQLVEELHQARFEKRLELNIVERYGELTCMDIDPPEEGTANTLSKNTLQQDLIIVLDTNILLSHLDYIKKIRSRGLGALGFPIVLVPWVVLQELDSLKNGRRLSSSVAHLATPAVQYIYGCLKSQEPHLWGQSMQQAAQSSYGLSAENNDDRVLQCCLQYQSLYPEGALILCTNDKNLCSKAMLSGVRALSKADLEVEVAKLKPSLSSFLHHQTPIRPQPDFRLHTQAQTSAHSRRQRCSQTQTQTQTQANPISPTLQATGEGEKKRERDRGKKRGKETNRGLSAAEAQELSTCLSMLEDCLKNTLSQILEEEMKAAYDDLWTEIVYNKPPWGLEKLLQCFRKHWIAVFGNIVPRNLLSTVVNLDHFLNSGKPAEQGSTVQALHQAKELLQAFRSRSDYGGLLPPALLSLDSLIHRVSPQSVKNESPERDAPMSDGEEKRSQHSQVTHQEVWSLFEKVWTKVCQISSAVFAALNFDPGTMEVRQLEGSAPPSQDALSFLPKLSSAVTHLLHAFSRLLSPDSDLPDTQALLSFIQSSEIATVEPRLTAKDLLDCFKQEEYREKLRVGGFQLTELNIRLEHCVEAMGQRSNPITWP